MIKLDELTECHFDFARRVVQWGINTLTEPSRPDAIGVVKLCMDSKKDDKTERSTVGQLLDGQLKDTASRITTDTEILEVIRAGMGLMESIPQINPSPPKPNAKIKLEYCGIWWVYWMIRYVIAAGWGCPTDWKRLNRLVAFCRYCPIIGSANDTAFVLPKPTKIRWKLEGTTPAPFSVPIHILHGNGVPSVEYPGCDLYHWNNVAIPRRMGTTHSEHWDPKWLLDEDNAEVRRILIQEVGYERMLQQLDATIVDTWREYELVEVKLDMPVPYRLLKMTCPSTGHIHVLRTPPDMQSAEHAIMWHNHGTHPDEFTAQS